MDATTRKRIVMLLYPGFSAFDAIAPYESLAHSTDYEFLFVADRLGSVADSGSLAFAAQASIEQVDRADVLIVPGGVPAIEMSRTGHPLIDWIADIHRTTRWTTGIWTGALMLGAAGVLRGLPATTHRYYWDELRSFGAIPVDSPLVEAGKVITAAGPSAGTDITRRLNERLSDEQYARLI
jgi:putative intracellular protease/amidase